jgi:anti-sigma B factor antagonist
MRPPALRAGVTDVGEVTVLDLEGRLVLDDGDAVFRESINDLIARGRLKIVVNFERVTYIDSAGIGVLIGRYLGVRRRGGDMKLAHLTTRATRVMTITQLLSVFEVYDSVDEAVASFARESPIGQA